MTRNNVEPHGKIMVQGINLLFYLNKAIGKRNQPTKIVPRPNKSAKRGRGGNKGVLCCTSPRLATTRNMVAVGLLNIPPEIQLQITEFVGTTKTLKALSVISRSLRSIAQSLLFKRFRIYLFKELRGSIDDLLANQQICAAIRVLEVGRFRLGSRLSIPHSTEERLSLIKRLLPELVGLRGVWIHQLNLNVTFMASVLEIAAKIPLKVKVGWNVYPSDISSMFSAPLLISHLHLGSIIDQPSLDFYRAVFRASAATLTELDMRSDGDGLMHLANIDLPCLHTLVLSLLIMTENKLSSTSAAAFITVQRTIRKLDLKGEVSLFPPLPPSALPDLRELHGSTELINQLVPGRPVEAIEIIAFRGSDQDWFGQEVAHSTARVRKLRVHLDAGMFNTQIVKRMVTVLPSLESLWLPVFHDVSRPFARDPFDSFSPRHSSKLSKLSLPSSASRICALVCLGATKHG